LDERHLVRAGTVGEIATDRARAAAGSIERERADSRCSATADAAVQSQAQGAVAGERAGATNGHGAIDHFLADDAALHHDAAEVVEGQRVVVDGEGAGTAIGAAEQQLRYGLVATEAQASRRRGAVEDGGIPRAGKEARVSGPARRVVPEGCSAILP